jgi:oligopeptidase A
MNSNDFKIAPKALQAKLLKTLAANRKQLQEILAQNQKWDSRNQNVFVISAKAEIQDSVETLDSRLRGNDRNGKKSQILTNPKYSWNNLLQPLEDMQERLHRVWATIEHLNAVVNSAKWREIYNQCLPEVTAYFTELAQNTELYKALKAIAAGSEFKKLNAAQKKVIRNELRDFVLAGIGLGAKEKKQYASLQKQLAQLAHKFAENLLDATQAWTYHTTQRSELDGIPELALAAAKEAAQKKKLRGWLFSLEQPSYLAVMTYADNRELRQKMYTAFVTRASEQGPNARKFDNTKIINPILARRLKLAKLVGFKNYAEYSLATKMAKRPQQVLKFLADLAKYSKSKAQAEFNELRQFALETYQIKKVEPWDVVYLSEKLRQEKFNFSQEDLRPYFPQEQVLKGIFKLIERLFKIKFSEKIADNLWHDSVKVFTIKDSLGEVRGYLYLDLYARSNKRGGAWMNDFVARRRLADGSIQLPTAFVVANFNPPVGNNSALFTHDEVNTLFHEFGHALQHLLTKMDCLGVSGINGIPWDAVEFPSQFMENWSWEWSVIKELGRHYKTGATLPKKLFEKMLAAKNFQTGLQMLRQIEFSLFDFRLHLEFNNQPRQVQKVLDEIRRQIAVLPVAKFNRFQNSFSHIFASSAYAAGYYSYKWAEVLSADAFAKFEEDGLFNSKTGAAFLQAILEPGGSVDPIQLFKQFRGRAPKINALLKHGGIFL